MDKVRSNTTMFGKRFIAEDQQKLRKELDPQHLKLELEKFMNMEKEVNDLINFTKRLQRRHAD